MYKSECLKNNEVRKFESSVMENESAAKNAQGRKTNSKAMLIS